MNRKISFYLALVLALIFPVCAFASPVSFKAQADVIISGEHEYKAIELTPEIYAETQNSLSDIMLFNYVKSGGSDTEEQIPYFINNSKSVRDAVDVSYAMRQTDSFVKDGYVYYDCALADEPDNDILATSLHLNTEDEFVINAELFGGYDGLEWEYVTAEKLFNIEGMSNLDFVLQPARKFTHYRIKMQKSIATPAFDEYSLSYRVFDDTNYSFEREISPKYETTQEDKTTVIKITGVKNLSIARAELDSDDIFKRAANVRGNSFEIFNLRFGENEYRNLTLDTQMYNPDDTLEIRINNGDDKPIEIKSVKLWYNYDELIFKAPESGGVKLFFGNDTMTKKQYDIESYKEHIISAGYDKVGLSDTVYNDSRDSGENGPDYKLILNIAVIIVALTLVFIIVKMLQKKADT